MGSCSSSLWSPRKTSLTMVSMLMPSHMRCEVTSSRSLSRCRLQQNCAELGLIVGKRGRQFALTLPPKIILVHPPKDAQWDLWGSVLFVIESVPLLMNQATQCGVLRLYAPQRQAQPLRINAAFQADEVDNVSVDHVLEGRTVFFS